MVSVVREGSLGGQVVGRSGEAALLAATLLCLRLNPGICGVWGGALGDAVQRSRDALVVTCHCSCSTVT